MTGLLVVPVPDKLTLVEPGVPLSLIVNIPLAEPVPVGRKVIVTRQLLPSANGLEQFCAALNGPVAWMLVTFSEPDPTLVKVKVCCMEAFTSVLGNVKLAAEAPSTAPVPELPMVIEVDPRVVIVPAESLATAVTV